MLKEEIQFKAQKIQFKAQYEYEGKRSAIAIREAIKDNFLFPCWTQRYQTKGGSIYLNMIDVRTFQFDSESIQLVREDEQQLRKMKTITQPQKKQEQGTNNPNKKQRGEIQNYKNETIKLVNYWDKFKQLFDPKKCDFWKDQFKFKQEKQLLKVYIFQRVEQHEGIVVKDYFLIRVQNQKNKDNKQDQIQIKEKIIKQIYSEQNWIFTLREDLQSFQQFKIGIKITFEGEKSLSPNAKTRYYTMPENQNVKILQITLQIDDHGQFFSKELFNKTKILQGSEQQKGKQWFKDYYYQIEQVINRNRVIFPYQECKFQRNKMHLSKHFHLAFQGGGAKGLAYVGAYSSLKHQTCIDKYSEPEKKISVPVNSIMGSSAGGIIALAISTGIPDYELQKICYKMSTIPKTDRYEHLPCKSDNDNTYICNNDTHGHARDDYGNRITFQKVIQNLAKILDQYGILQKDKFLELVKYLKTEKDFEPIYDKLLQWLCIVSPAAAQILTQYYSTVIKTGWWNVKETTVDLKKINLEGLLLHGALMKGEAIHDIARDCLVKFLLQESSFRDKAQFKQYLRECLEPQKNSPQHLQSQNIYNLLEKHIQLSVSLIKLDLADLDKVCKYKMDQKNRQNRNTFFAKFAIFLINRFMILTDSFLQGQEKHELQRIQKQQSQIGSLFKQLLQRISSQRQTGDSVKVVQKKLKQLSQINLFLKGLQKQKQQDVASLISAKLKKKQTLMSQIIDIIRGLNTQLQALSKTRSIFETLQKRLIQQAQISSILWQSSEKINYQSSRSLILKELPYNINQQSSCDRIDNYIKQKQKQKQSISPLLTQMDKKICQQHQTNSIFSDKLNNQYQVYITLKGLQKKLSQQQSESRLIFKNLQQTFNRQSQASLILKQLNEKLNLQSQIDLIFKDLQQKFNQGLQIEPIQKDLENKIKCHQQIHEILKKLKQVQNQLDKGLIFLHKKQQQEEKNLLQHQNEQHEDLKIPLRIDNGSLLEYFILAFQKRQEQTLDHIVKQNNLDKNTEQYKKLSQQMDNITNINRQLIKRKQLKSISYSQLNSILGCNNLIDPSDPKSMQLIKWIRGKSITIIDLMNQIFDNQLNKIQINQTLKGNFKERNQKNVNKLFYSLQAAQAINEIFTLLAQDSKLDQNKQIRQSQTFGKYFSQYKENLKEIKKQIGKINMLQYYRLTGIQLSCTSVDLDNKVLRFFNHKTTPKLPVCKAVQMTGSFPVGFKAQKWLKQWGKYHVYLLEQKLEIDLTGHEFTDGGLLANFPIKYMDNDLMRKRYFSHTAVKGQTVLLGFGLDYMTEDRYQKTQAQIEQDNEQKKKSTIILMQLKNLLTSWKIILKNGYKTLWNTEEGNSNAKWTQIEHHLVDQIPLLRFGRKIADAYPNADRNLNLEAFQNKVFKQQLGNRWQPVTKYQSNQKSKENEKIFFEEFINNFNSKYGLKEKVFIKQFIYEFNSHIYEKYDPQWQQKEKINQIQHSIKERKDSIQDKITTTTQNKIKTLEHTCNGYLSLLKEKGGKLFQINSEDQPVQVDKTDKKNQQEKDDKKDKKGESNKDQSNQQGKPGQNSQLNERQLSLRLIKIFYLHLQMVQNAQIAQRYTKLYIFMKYIAENLQQKNDKNPPIVDSSKDQDIEPTFNRIIFNHLYNKEMFEEISNHFQFLDYPNKHYQQFVDIFKQDSVQGKQYETEYEKYRTSQRLKTLKIIEGKYKNQQFFDIKLYDVTVSLRRVVQLIYLMIRGRDGKKLIQAKNLQQLGKNIKTENFQNLLFENSGEPYNKQLMFTEIVQFLKQELNNFKSNNVVVLGFKEFLQKYPIKKNKKDQYQYENIYTLYIKNFLTCSDCQNINEDNQNSANIQANKMNKNSQRWYNQLYDLIINGKWNSNLKDIMKQSIKLDILNSRKNKENQMKDKKISEKQQYELKSQTSKLLYYLLFSTKATQKNLEYLEQIDRMLVFVIDQETDFEPLFNPPISIAKEQSIKRMKSRSLDILFHMFQAYFLPQNLKAPTEFKEINCFVNVIKPKDYFRDQINQQQIKLTNDYELKQKVRSHLKDWLKKNDNNEDNLRKLSQIDDNCLKIIQLNAIRRFLQGKFDEKKKLEKDQAKIQHLKLLNESFYSDMWFLFHAIKSVLFLTQSFLERPKNQEQQEAVKKNGKYQIEENNIKSYQKIFKKIMKDLFEIYKQIFENFVSNYQKLSELHIDMIDESSLSDCFIIKYKWIRKLATDVYMRIKNLYQKIKNVSEEFDKSEEFIKASETISSIYRILTKFNKHVFSIPLFDADWKLSVQSTMLSYQRKVVNLLAKQVDKKIDNFDKQLQDVGKDFYPKDIDRDVHLILEGVEHSNEYFGGLYVNIDYIFEKYKQQTSQKIQKNSKQKDNGDEKSRKLIGDEIDDNKLQKIKMITCSNFHSVFGFLLSMGYDHEAIRKEMHKLYYITNIMENKQKIESYFNSYSWTCNPIHSQRDWLQFLQKEQQFLFDRLKMLPQQDYANISLQNSMKQIRLLYEHEKEQLMKIYQNILDEVCDNIKQIEAQPSSKYPLQIAKRFAINYNCKLDNGTHDYLQQSKTSIKQFKSLSTRLFETFGSLLGGIIANALVQGSAFDITEDNYKHVAKGLIVNKLLTTFKLKQYITDKLKQKKISPSITLSKFYEVAERQIVLNFTVIDINSQRLTFLNKNTMPNMPLWAAVLATSTLPFYHRFFQGNKEWEAADSKESYIEFFNYEFFKADPDVNTQFTNYTSGNFVSSLPLELLTNNMIRAKLFGPQNIKRFKEFAICFNPSYQNHRVVDMRVEQKFLNIRLKDIWSVIKSTKSGGSSGSCKKQVHKNNAYQSSYSILQYFKDYFRCGTLMATFDTLSNSNDNLIMKWYYDKLIRLPIKIGTLDFHLIIDKKALQKYGVNILTQKAAETIECSQQITQSFIHQITQRIQDQALQKPQQDRRYQKQFNVKFRVSFFQQINSLTGFSKLLLKLDFLNHSKWNHNKFNNFIIEHQISGFSYRKVNESEINWLIEDGTKTKLKFSYMIEASLIKITEFQLDFNEFIQKYPLKDSFDYQFEFGWNDVKKEKIQNKISPIKRNGYGLGSQVTNQKEENLPQQQGPVNIERQTLLKMRTNPKIGLKLQKDYIFNQNMTQKTSSTDPQVNKPLRQQKDYQRWLMSCHPMYKLPK